MATKKKNKKLPVEWVDGRWSDYADDVRSLSSDLRAYGIRCRTTDNTIYEGHRSLCIAKPDLAAARKLLRQLPTNKFVGLFK
jgi:hypothetical protein